MKRANPGGKSKGDGRAPAPAKVRVPANARKAAAVSTRAAKVSNAAELVLGTGLGDSAAARNGAAIAVEIDAVVFRRRLMAWYRAQARTLPWRGATDPYHIWVSEIMLQQTRVAAVIEHYNEFVRRFPTLVSLALAPEADVLAAWSGLGYYRRARMLHKAAQFIMLEREGRLPVGSVELRTLPGIGDYTAAAIASIAFGEAVAVVDGNVERVILRLTGRSDEANAASRAFIRTQAQELMPEAAQPALHVDAQVVSGPAERPRGWGWDATERIALAASARPTAPAGGEGTYPHLTSNAAGDHNQAMMELGATLCLPRTPLCLQCPVQTLCKTRGEHTTPARGPQRSLPVACLLDLRKKGLVTEVLLALRPAASSIMPAMFELPQLPLDAAAGREPLLRVRHAITNTNYYVQVFSPRRHESGRSQAQPLRRAIPKGSGELHWANVSRLPGLPLTGLARKILRRLHVMEGARISLLEE
jgi:A/G-specific adenine glycosylase